MFLIFIAIIHTFPSTPQIYFGYGQALLSILPAVL